MPELPEVETIRMGLDQSLPTQIIAGVSVLWPKSFSANTEHIKRYVVGQKISALERRAKVLIIKLNNEYALMVHLKMTGQLVLVPVSGDRFAGGHPTTSMIKDLPDSSTRVVIELASGDKLFFNDQRKFGWIKLLKQDEIEQDSLVSRLGPEPLSEQFELAGFRAVIRRRARSPIKAVLLDQTTVSGIGNIYADESLHLAKIHPARLSGSLKGAETKQLHEAIKIIMGKAIGYGGTSFTNYVNALGLRGNYLEHARVFRRQGKACPECGTIIEKIKVVGRGTHVCSQCQVLK